MIVPLLLLSINTKFPISSYRFPRWFFVQSTSAASGHVRGAQLQRFQWGDHLVHIVQYVIYYHMCWLCVCIYAYPNTYMAIYYIYIYMYIYICYWFGCVDIYIYVQAHEHAYMHACMHADVHTCVQAYMHTNVHMHMHTDCIWIHLECCTLSYASPSGTQYDSRHSDSSSGTGLEIRPWRLLEESLNRGFSQHGENSCKPKRPNYRPSTLVCWFIMSTLD